MANRKERLEIELILKDLLSAPLKKVEAGSKTLVVNFKALQKAVKDTTKGLGGLGVAFQKLKADQQGLSRQVQGARRALESFTKRASEAGQALSSLAKASSQLTETYTMLSELSRKLQAQEQHLAHQLERQAAAYNRLARAAFQAARAKREAAGTAPGKPIDWTGLGKKEEEALRRLPRALSSGLTAQPKKLLTSLPKFYADLGRRLAFAEQRSISFSSSISQQKARLQALRNPLLGSAKATIQLSKVWQKLGKQFKSVGMEMNRFSFTFRRLFGILAAFAAARYALASFVGLVRQSVLFNANLEQSRIGIATLLMATSDIKDQFGRLVPEGQRFAVALKESDRQIQKLRLDALKSTATFQQLVETYQIALAPGVQAGLNPDQIRKFALRISQAAAAIGLPMNQLAEEIRSTLAGTIQLRTTRIAAALGITNEDIRNAKKAGKLYEFLNEKFAAFAKTQYLAANTFTGLTQRMKDFSSIVVGMAGSRFFSELKGYLRELLKSSVVIEDGLVRPSKRAVQAFKLIFEQLELILKDLHDLAGGNFFFGIARIVTTLLQVGKLIAHYFIGGFKVVFALLKGISLALSPLTTLARATGIEFKYWIQAVGAVVLGSKILFFLTSKIYNHVLLIKNGIIATKAILSKLFIPGQLKEMATSTGRMVKNLLNMRYLVAGLAVGFAVLANIIAQKILGTQFSALKQLHYGWLLLKNLVKAVAYAIAYAFNSFLLKATEALRTFHLVSKKTVEAMKDSVQKSLESFNKYRDFIKRTNEDMNKLEVASSRTQSHVKQSADSAARFEARMNQVYKNQERFNLALQASSDRFEAMIIKLKGLEETGGLNLRQKYLLEARIALLQYLEDLRKLQRQETFELNNLRAQRATQEDLRLAQEKWAAKRQLLGAKFAQETSKAEWQYVQALMAEKHELTASADALRLVNAELQQNQALQEAQLAGASHQRIVELKLTQAAAERALKAQQIRDELHGQLEEAARLGYTEEKRQTLIARAESKLKQLTLEYRRQTFQLERQKALYEGGIPAALTNGLRLFADDYADTIQRLSQLTQQMTEKLADFISQSIVDAFDPTKDKTIKERFGEFLQELGRMLIQFAVKQAIAKAIVAAVGGGGVAVGAWEGGETSRLAGRARPSLAHLSAPGFADGGRPSGLHPSDTIPIWVAPGEFILRRSAVEKYGLQALEALNQGLLPESLLRGVRASLAARRGPGFAEGGAVPTKVVSSSEPARSADESKVVPAVIVANDEALDRLLSGGKAAFFQFMQAHAHQIKEALQ